MPLDARVCDYCKESFVPRRVDQRFCVGKDCRKRFHDEYNFTHVHTCWHCGRNHDPEEPAFFDVLELTLKGLLLPSNTDVKTPAQVVDHLLELLARRRGSVGVVPDDADVP